MSDTSRIDGLRCPEAELVPWYVNGTLEDDERARVCDHLGHCAECRGELEDFQEVRSQIRLAREGTPSADLAQRVLERLEHEAPTRLPSPARVSPTWVGTAAGLSLAAGVVAGLGLGQLLGRGPSEVPWDGPATLHLLSSPYRDGGAATRVEVRPEAPFVLLAVPPLEELLDGSYVARIRSADGVDVWSTRLSSSRIRETTEPAPVLTFPVPPQRLPEGSYELSLETDGASLVTHAFEIVHRRR